VRLNTPLATNDSRSLGVVQWSTKRGHWGEPATHSGEKTSW